MLDMAKKDIFPAVSAYSGALSKNALAKKELSSSISCESEIALIEKLSKLSSCLMKSADELENALMCAAECGDIRATAEYYRDQVIPRMQELRAVGCLLYTSGMPGRALSSRKTFWFGTIWAV